MIKRIESKEDLDTIKATKEDFQLVQLDEVLRDEKFEGEPIGFFKDAWIRFKSSRAAFISGIIILLIVLMSIIGPSLSEYTYREQNIEFSLLPPRIPGLEKLGIADGTKVISIRKENLDEYKDVFVKEIGEYNIDYKGKEIPMLKIKVDQYKNKGAEDKYFWFGSDSLGRDIWTRLWRGSRISLFIGFTSVVINVFIGVVYGAISGYYGGWVDMIMQRFIEILEGIPQMAIIILLMVFLGAGIGPFIIVLVITGWTGMSRMIRAQFYRYKGQEYVLASRTMGAKDRLLIFRHILPNAIGPIITQATFAVPGAIFMEATLSYLGLGIQAPEPSIGVLLSEGQKVLLDFPHLILFPAVLISVLMLAFNLLGNGLRDAFDPTLRGN